MSGTVQSALNALLDAIISTIRRAGTHYLPRIQKKLHTPRYYVGNTGGWDQTQAVQLRSPCSCPTALGSYGLESMPSLPSLTLHVHNEARGTRAKEMQLPTALHNSPARNFVSACHCCRGLVLTQEKTPEPGPARKRLLGLLDSTGNIRTPGENPASTSPLYRKPQARDNGHLARRRAAGSICAVRTEDPGKTSLRRDEHVSRKV